MLFTALLEQHIASGLRPERFNLLVLGIETLHEASGVINLARCEALLLALKQKLRRCIDESAILAQLSNTEFAILPKGIERPFHAMQLARSIMIEINAPLSMKDMALRPSASVGIAHYFNQEHSAEHLLRTSTSAMMSAQRTR